MPSKSILCIVWILFVCTSAFAQPDPKPLDLAPDILSLAKFQSLFDGKTLAGWHVIGQGDWSVEDGVVVGRHKAAQDFGHLVTDASFNDFILRVKFKAIRGNSGLYFRIEEKGASGVSGFQGEIDPNQDTGGLYETNGRAWVVKPTAEDVKRWYKPNEWNQMIVSALGRHVCVYVNGMKSAEIVDDPGRLSGKIALQMHGGQDNEIYFKDLDIARWQNLMPGPGMAGFNKSTTGDWLMVGEVAKDSSDEKKLASKPGTGILLNSLRGHTTDVLTEGEFGDVAAHIEFLIPAKSNSGIYFESRYELQVYDSFSIEKDAYPGIECGGLYPRWINNHEVDGHSPRVNVSLPPGQWQSFDVVFQSPRFDASGKKTANAKFVKVYHNGTLIHENVERTGPTRAAIWENEKDEKPTGPLMFQGDHGPVAYRNLRVMPLK